MLCGGVRTWCRSGRQGGSCPSLARISLVANMSSAAHQPERFDTERSILAAPRWISRSNELNPIDWSQRAAWVRGVRRIRIARTRRRARRAVCQTRGVPTRRTTSEDYERRILRVQQLLEVRLDEPVVPADLAKAASFSLHHFQTVFRAQLGETVMQRAAPRARGAPAPRDGRLFYRCTEGSRNLTYRG
jgi:AraC-like DNA-binding protein